MFLKSLTRTHKLNDRRIRNKLVFYDCYGRHDELPNLRALCSTCNQGAKNVTGEKPTGLWLLSQIRRAGQDEQRAVYDWLKRKFGPGG